MGCQKKSQINDKKCRNNENPSHKVCLTGFWIGRYEVTQAEYQTIMNTNPSGFYNKNHPVENISWDDAMEFASQLTRKNNNQTEFSLPTEAQWEYACRNMGKNIIFPWRTNSLSNLANCGNCNTSLYNDATTPVGTFQPNNIGLYDMGGNVSEWCLDVYDKNTYLHHANLNPVSNKTGSSHTVRGGSFVDNRSSLRCTARKGLLKSMKSNHTGFRLIRKENFQSQ